MRALEIILEIFFCSFSSLFQIFCVKRPDGMLGDVWTEILIVQTVFLVSGRYGLKIEIDF
jgi:hypothetical protein